MTPLMIAIVAGVAPLSLKIFSTAFAVSTFSGYGIPKYKERKKERVKEGKIKIKIK